MADSEKTYTEREVIIRERKAVARMRCAVMHELHFDDPNDQACFACLRRAAEVHPLPSKVVPRVVTDPIYLSNEWSVMNGALVRRHVKFRDRGWDHFADRGSSDWAPLPERVRMWADLFANPTETIADDGAPA